MATLVGSDSLAARVRAAGDGGPVPGLLFRVPADRLRDLLAGRAEYHRARAAEKRGELPGLEAAIRDVSESVDRIKGLARAEAAQSVTTKAAPGYGFDPGSDVRALQQEVDQLRKDIRDHDAKALSFGLLADSLFPADYALSHAELVSLELCR